MARVKVGGVGARWQGWAGWVVGWSGPNSEPGDRLTKPGEPRGARDRAGKGFGRIRDRPGNEYASFGLFWSRNVTSLHVGQHINLPVSSNLALEGKNDTMGQGLTRAGAVAEPCWVPVGNPKMDSRWESPTSNLGATHLLVIGSKVQHPILAIRTGWRSFGGQSHSCHWKVGME